MHGSNRGTAAAFSEAHGSRITRLLALLLGFAMLCFGMVAGGGTAAHADGTATVTGKLTGWEQETADHTQVSVGVASADQQGGEGWGDGGIDAAGNFQLTGLDAGEYYLTLYVSNGSSGDNRFQSFQILNVGTPSNTVTVADGATVSLTQDVPVQEATASIAGHVQVQNKDRAQVLLRQKIGSEWVSMESAWSSSGQEPFDYTTYKLVPGEYRVLFLAYNDGESPEQVWWDDVFGEQLAQSVVLVAGQQRTGIDALFRTDFDTRPSGVTVPTARVGSPVTAQLDGAWTPAPDTIEYRWNPVGSGGPGGPPQFVGQTYIPAPGDAGGTVLLQVTAERADRKMDFVETWVEILPGELTAPTPTISGSTQVDQTLTANPGTWGPAPVSLSYQWLSDGEPISDAESSTYALVAADQGKRISVEITGTKDGYATESKTSAQTAVVAAPDFDWSVDPTITGTPRIGANLTVNAGEIAPAPDAIEYVWLRDGDEIDGADQDSYTPTAGDLGRALSAQVTVSKSGFADETRTTAAVDIAEGTLTAPTPTIAGTAQVGQTLTATPGTWGPAPVSLAYQWLRDGSAISGATSSAYTPVAADQGKRISVKVTGTKAGYESASKTSAQTAAVAAKPDPEPTKPPFADVSKNQKFAKEITWMYTSGLSTGVKTPTGREYQPKNGVSREAMAAFLYRMEGAEYIGPKVSPFADVKPGDKFYNEITWMYAKGLSTGVKQSSGKPSYQPKVTVTREAMAAFIYRLEETKYTAPSTSFFSDVSRGDKFYREISWMYDSGLSTGVKQPSGKPAYQSKARVTREAMAAFLYRLEN